MLLGTFVKTPGPHNTEALGTAGLDFVVIDEEHAPFDRGSIDLALLGARAGGIAGLVRVSDAGHLLAALDDGATGVLIPHVDSPQRAAEVVSLCRYRGGSRGFSNTTRAGGYGGRGHLAARRCAGRRGDGDRHDRGSARPGACGCDPRHAGAGRGLHRARRPDRGARRPGHGLAADARGGREILGAAAGRASRSA